MYFFVAFPQKSTLVASISRPLVAQRELVFGKTVFVIQFRLIFGPRKRGFFTDINAVQYHFLLEFRRRLFGLNFFAAGKGNGLGDNGNAKASNDDDEPKKAITGQYECSDDCGKQYDPKRTDL